MAGGELAEDVPCMVCLTEHSQLVKATRTREGQEGDQYRCEKGHEFGLDWPRPATTPQWPPDPELVAALADK